MMLPVFKGVLINENDNWFVKYKRTLKSPVLFVEEQEVEDKLQVFPDENSTQKWLEQNINTEVQFTVAKKYLAIETLWYGKIVIEQKKQSWDDIFKSFNMEVDLDMVNLTSFQEWLKQKYKAPKLKK